MKSSREIPSLFAISSALLFSDSDICTPISELELSVLAEVSSGGSLGLIPLLGFFELRSAAVYGTRRKQPNRVFGNRVLAKQIPGKNHRIRRFSCKTLMIRHRCSVTRRNHILLGLAGITPALDAENDEKFLPAPPEQCRKLALVAGTALHREGANDQIELWIP